MSTAAQPRSADVMCAGILVADLFVPPLARLPAPGELVQTGPPLLDTGGCAANVATDLARLGVASGVAGRVGRDVFGDYVRADLVAKGLADVEGIRVSDNRPTSQTVILPVRGEDRRYIHSVGANADFRVEDVDRDRAGAVRAFYLGGYGILPGIEPAALGALLSWLRARGVLTILDVAGVPPGQGHRMLSPVLPHVDAFLPNDDEARILTGEADPVRQAEALVELGVRTAVVTCGERGLVAASRQELVRAAAFTVEVVDASGSGDAFAAGFILSMLEGWDLERALPFASAVGASCCTRLGCTAGVFSRGEAEAFHLGHPLAVERMKRSTP